MEKTFLDVLWIVIGVILLILTAIKTWSDFHQPKKMFPEPKPKEMREYSGLIRLEIWNVYSIAESKLIVSEIEKILNEQNVCKSENHKLYMEQRFEYIEKALLEKEGK